MQNMFAWGMIVGMLFGAVALINCLRWHRHEQQFEAKLHAEIARLSREYKA